MNEIDWVAVRAEYRAGLSSYADLARRYGCTKQAVSKRARAEGWGRDLNRVVREIADAKVIARTANQAVRERMVSDLTRSDMPVALAATLAAAEVSAGIVMAHRSETGQARQVAHALLRDLRLLVEQREDIEALVLAGCAEGAAPESVGLAQRAVGKLLALPEQIAALRTLADAMTKLHEAERRSYRLDEGDAPEPLRDMPDDELDRMIVDLSPQAGYEIKALR